MMKMSSNAHITHQLRMLEKRNEKFYNSSTKRKKTKNFKRHIL